MPPQPPQGPPQDPRKRPPPTPPQPPKIVIRRPGPVPAPAPPPPAPGGPAPAGAQHGTFKGVRILWWTLSLQGIVLIASGSVLTVIGLIIFYLSVVNYGLRANFTQALQAHDSNNQGAALRDLEDTLWWSGRHHWAREVRAKIRVEDGRFDLAQRDYEFLLASGHRAASVYAGLGALQLRKADQEKDDAAAVKLAEAALGHYANARGIPEEHIGPGVANLFIARRTRNPAKLETARSHFEKALKSVNEGGGKYLSRSGALDLYAGYALCLGLSGKNLEEAVRHSRRAIILEPRWPTPEANLYLIVAKWWRESPPTADLQNYRPEIHRLLDESRPKAELTSHYPMLSGPWVRMGASVMRLYGKLGELDKPHEIVGFIRSMKVDASLAEQSRAALFAEAFDPADPQLDSTLVNRHFLPAFKEVADNEKLTDAKGAHARAVTLNYVAAAREWFVSRSNPTVSGYEEIRALLTLAARLDPSYAPTWVNLSVVNSRMSRHEHDPGRKAQLKAEAEAARDKAAGLFRPDDPRGGEQLDKLRRVLGEGG